MSGDTAFVRKMKERVGAIVIKIVIEVEGKKEQQYLSCSPAEHEKLLRIAKERGTQVPDLIRYGKAIVR